MNQKERIVEYKKQIEFLIPKVNGRYTPELDKLLVIMKGKWKHIELDLYGDPSKLTIGAICKSEGRGIHLEILINNINIEKYDEYINWRNNNPSTSSITL